MTFVWKFFLYSAQWSWKKLNYHKYPITGARTLYDSFWWGKRDLRLFKTSIILERLRRQSNAKRVPRANIFISQFFRVFNPQLEIYGDNLELPCFINVRSERFYLILIQISSRLIRWSIFRRFFTSTDDIFKIFRVDSVQWLTFWSYGISHKKKRI